MTKTRELIRRSDELKKNDMFTLAGVHYIVDEIDDTDPDYRKITASQMIGRETWSITLTVPNACLFHAYP